MEDAWLLVKRDLYYRPNGEGYTGVRDRAGRYSEAEAKKGCYDAGPDGNSVTMVRLADAPEYTKACWDDVARSHLREKLDGMRAAMEQAIKIIDTNLYHQREKVKDAVSILRDALKPQ